MQPKPALILVYIAVLCVLFVMPASAEVLRPDMVDLNKTVSFADLGLIGQQDIQIWVGPYLVETGNTTAGYLYQPIGDYFIVVKPSLANRWLNKPDLLLKDAVSYLLEFALPIFIILGLGAILIGLARYGGRKS
jgi:hypothetical protein